MGDTASEKWLAGWEGELRADAGETSEDVAALLGDVMDHLLICGDIEDPTIEFDAPNRVTFEAVMVGTDPIDVMTRWSFILRACLHAGGIGTPHWATSADIKQGARHHVTFEPVHATSPTLLPA